MHALHVLFVISWVFQFKYMHLKQSYSELQRYQTKISKSLVWDKEINCDMWQAFNLYVLTGNRSLLSILQGIW